MSLIRTSGSYIANVAMIGGIHIDSDTKKFEHLIGGGDDADAANQLLSGFSGSATASVIAALNHVYEEATTGQVSTSANNTFTGDNTFSGKLSASNGLAVTSGGAVKLSAGEESVTLGNSSEQTVVNGSQISIAGASGVGVQGATTFQDAVSLSSGMTASNGINFAASDDPSLVFADESVASLADNKAAALDIKEGSNSYLKFITTNGSEQVVFGKNSTFAGTTIADLGTVTTADINGGTINGVTVAESDVTVGTGKTLNVSDGTLTLANDQISGDKINGGTIGSITISQLAGALDANNQAMTNVDIDSGAIDGTNIGANSAGTGAFTTLAASGVATFSGEITASVGMNIPDDQKLYFGTNFDASIEYDEDGTDELRFAGNAVRFEQLVTFGGEITASVGMLIKDDQKLYFGDGKDASIEYDEDGDDKLKFAGAAVSFGAAITSSAGIDVAADKDIIFRGGGGPVLFDSEDSQFYRVEVQGGLLVLVSLGEGAAL